MFGYTYIFKTFFQGVK